MIVMSKIVGEITNFEVDEKARVKEVRRGQYTKVVVPNEGRYTAHDVSAKDDVCREGNEIGE